MSDMTFVLDSLEDTDSPEWFEPAPDGNGFRLRGSKAPGEMTRAEKASFISEKGLEAWKRLLFEHSTAGAAARKRAARQRYIDEHGHDAWLKKLAEERRR